MKKFIALFLIGLISFSFSCSKEEEDDSINRIIPPITTMQIDLSTIEDLNSSKSLNKVITAEEGLCIGVAWLLVVWSNAVCYTPLLLPVAIYQVLKNQIPTDVSETHVEWTYTVTYQNETYTVSVSADKNGGEYDWDWSVSINDIVLITGGSMEDLTAGEWQYYDPTGTPGANKTILVEWTRSSSTDGTVKFTNNSDDPAQAAKVGDYILYTRTGNDVEVRFHDVNSGTDDLDPLLDISVYWNVSTNAGGIRANEGNLASVTECTWDPAD